MDERERRLAQNEALFRDVNERIEVHGYDPGTGGRLTEFFCECADKDCTLRISATTREYESVRASPHRFMVLPEHTLPEIESVVERHDRYWVIQKSGEAADYVERLDPRSRS